MTRLMKTYYEIFRAGDTKRVASLYEPDQLTIVNDYYPTAQTMTEVYEDLRSARMSVVLHWGEYQFGSIPTEATAEGGGIPRYFASHAARCVGNTCHISVHVANNQLGGFVAAAFADKGAAQFEGPAQGETTLPILPAAVDAAQKAVATNPIVLHLNRTSHQTTLAASMVVSRLNDILRVTSPKQPTFENVALYSAGTPSHVTVFQRGDDVSAYDYSAYVTWFANHAPWTVSTVYSLGPDVCVALLKSDKGRALHLLPLQRAGNGWTIISHPADLKAWWVLSSISTYQALQNR